MGKALYIDYPSTLHDALRQTRVQFSQEARMAMAVKLFEWKQLLSSHPA